MFEFFGRGLLLGVAIAAPVGPIGVLCIRHTLLNGRGTGLVAGLGAATADGIYGCIAGLGLSAMSGGASTVADLLIRHQRLLGIGGGLFLVYLGGRTFLSQATNLNQKATLAETDSHGEKRLPHPRHSQLFLLKTYLETLLLTLANPATILSFSAIFLGLDIMGESRDYGAALALVVGVFMGSGLWWVILSSGVSRVGDRLTALPLKGINRVSGAIIIAFGLVAIWFKG